MGRFEISLWFFPFVFSFCTSHIFSKKPQFSFFDCLMMNFTLFNLVGWLGWWENMFPNNCCCSWKLLCHASSFIAKSIGWRTGVLQKKSSFHLSSSSRRILKSCRFDQFGRFVLHGILAKFKMSYQRNYSIFDDALLS